MTSLFDAELMLDLLERHAFRLGNPHFYPDQLQHHHEAEKGENIARWKGGDHLGEKGGEQGGENPVGEGAERLAFGAMAVGEDFRDKNPDHGSLTDGVRGDEGSRRAAKDACMSTRR